MTNKASLGEFLRLEREKRGITIDQIASATKINIRLLHSLEADQYADLPAKPFVRGFVTSYARFINMDPQDVLTRFGDFIEERIQERPNREVGHSGYAFEKKDSERSRTLLWIVMASFVVLGGTVIFFVKPVLKHRKASHLEKIKAAHEKALKDQVQVEGDSKKQQPDLNSAPLDSKDALVATVPAVPTPSKDHGAALPEVKEVMGNSTEKPGAGKPEASLTSTSLTQTSTTTEVSKSTATQSATATKTVTSSKTATASSTATATTTKTSSATQTSTSTGSSTFSGTSTSTGTSTEVDKDPMKKGNGLSPQDTRHKVVFKAKTNVWVRYQVDDYTTQTIMLGKGRLLVLKGRSAIGAQVSNPNAVELKYRSEGFSPFVSSKHAQDVGGAKGIFVANQHPEKTKELFDAMKPLPATPDPTEADESSAPAPAEPTGN